MKDEVNYKQIGQKIRKLREGASLSQREVAEEVGFASGTAISLIESASRRVSLTDLQKISNALEVEIGYFLGTDKSVAADVIAALRADANLSSKDKDRLSEYYKFLRNRKRK